MVLVSNTVFKFCFFSDLLFRAKSIILYQCYIIGKIDISAFFCFVQARKYVTPAVRCQGKLGYAVAKSNIRSILGDKDSFEAAIKAVHDGGLGEDNPVRDFNSANGDGKQKQRALVFRRTAIPSYLRKRLDKGKTFLLYVLSCYIVLLRQKKKESGQLIANQI